MVACHLPLAVITRYPPLTEISEKKKIDKDKQHCSTSNGPSSPQKKAVEGYTKCVSMNIQDFMLLDAGEQEAFEEEIVNDNETGDEPQIM
ncbi:hypothetical protein M422DRAFT_253230 [Sphaerobolus stellatus SS14]|uniref:Uncharacterized protein n=1 Tax=Sphaerobolus stellatus (strain SS14) TaxID=990650 RepID=A0A0C9VWX6_SPHS4|nr:hypothetical protein M422DRAFT_253230 [Sphaerobolus stellatus SS14]